MIPLATTTITVRRSSLAVDTDPYDPPAPTIQAPAVATGVRAVIGVPTASTVLSGGDRVVYTAQLRCDPCDVQADDLVSDDTTGSTWTVMSATRVTAVGLDLVQGELRLTSGVT